MNPAATLRIAIIGAGWAGMAAAVRAVQGGHRVTVFEAARTLGGRARGVPLTLPDGRQLMVDNGQHILIGAYTETLRLMRLVGIDPDKALMRLPLAIRFPDGSGLRLPYWPAPWDAVAGIVGAHGWPWHDKLALLGTARAWQRAGFLCDPLASVADLCTGLPQRLMEEFIDLLCLSALNTPVHEASGAVFLRVLHDGLFSQRGGSNVLLPRVDLSALLPDAAARWIETRGAHVRIGQRVDVLHWQAPHWAVLGEPFDHVVLATSASNAATMVSQSQSIASELIANVLSPWSTLANRLQHRAITTVYAQLAPDLRGRSVLAAPMIALRAGPSHPAQFVFERDAIQTDDTATGLLAFVISNSEGTREQLAAAVTQQARAQLGLAVQPLLTVIEKRATFVCTPALQRPGRAIAPGLSACGDYVDGPYPATIEGAVRSGLSALG